MDIRFLIVGAPFIFAFFYSLFWLRKWGAIKKSFDKHQKKINFQDDSFRKNYILYSYI